MDCGREDVVRGLAHVHVVVGMNAFAGDLRDHLVRVHVRRGAGARLEDVDRKLVVEVTCGDPVGGGGDALRLVGLEEPELGVHARGGGLDATEPAGYMRGDRLARDLEVLDRLVRFEPPELVHAASLSRHEIATDTCGFPH